MMFGDMAERMMALKGKEFTAMGVITVEQLPDSIARLETAVTEDKASRAGPKNGADEDEPRLDAAPGGPAARSIFGGMRLSATPRLDPMVLASELWQTEIQPTLKGDAAMMKRQSGWLFSLMISVAVAAFLLASRPLFAADAGTIEEVSGNVTITGVDSKIRRAHAKDKIQSGEVVTTESKSEAFIKMGDESAFVVRPKTEFKLANFTYQDAKSPDSCVVSLLRGAARMITGLIGQRNHAQVSINTPTATIGIRGTDFEVAVVREDTSDARAGVYDYVRDGSTYVQLASGRESLDVPKEKTGFAPEKVRPGEAPLQLLPETPIFLQQGGGLDALVQSLTMQPINILHQMPTFH